MQVRPLAGDEPGAAVRYAVALHVLMSQGEMALWERFADRHRLELDDAMHAAALSGLASHLARDGDEVGRQAAEDCVWELIARLGLEAANRAGGPG